MGRLGPVARQVARIQHLCSLGLGGQLVMPELMTEMRRVIPSGSNTFFWAAPNLDLANMHSDSPATAEYAPLYLETYHNRLEREVLWTFTEYMRHDYASPVATMHERVVKVHHHDFVKSSMYNEICRPLGFDQMLQAQITGSGRKLGSWQIGRPADSAAFTSREMIVFGALIPFIAHAVTDLRFEDRYTETEDRGFIIANGQGQVQHYSRRANALFLMAAYPTFSPATARRMQGQPLPDPVLRLCKTLAEYDSGAGLLNEPPVILMRNDWGEFLIRGYSLDPNVTGSNRLIGMAIERKEPYRLKLVRRIATLPLSYQESRICLELVSGRGRADIAADMRISDQTLIAHCRSLYAKLDVHTRAELTQKLQAP